MEIINSIFIAVNVITFNEEYLNVDVISKGYEMVTLRLNKIFDKFNNVNIYQYLSTTENYNIKWEHHSLQIKIKYNNDTVYIFKDDDIHYNHVNDLCSKNFHIYPKEYNTSYSVYIPGHILNKNFSGTLTIFTNPLKYHELTNLVLTEYLSINNITQDIKDNILQLYYYV
jgi:hypothetical protein